MPEASVASPLKALKWVSVPALREKFQAPVAGSDRGILLLVLLLVVPWSNSLEA